MPNPGPLIGVSYDFTESFFRALLREWYYLVLAVMFIAFVAFIWAYKRRKN